MEFEGDYKKPEEIFHNNLEKLTPLFIETACCGSSVSFTYNHLVYVFSIAKI